MSEELGVLDRYLTVWIGLAMLVGVALGRFVPGVADALNAVTWHGTSLPIAVGLFVMIFPIMAEEGFDLSDRVPREIPVEELRSCDHVATMGCSTLGLGDAKNDVDVRDWALSDPHGADLEGAREIRDEIERLVGELFDELEAEYGA